MATESLEKPASPLETPIEPKESKDEKANGGMKPFLVRGNNRNSEIPSQHNFENSENHNPVDILVTGWRNCFDYFNQ